MATKNERFKDSFELWPKYYQAYTDFVQWVETGVLAAANLSTKWQKYTQSYAEFAVEATQRMTEQSMAYWELMDQIATDTIKKAQVVNAKEQKAALDAAETFQEQAQTTSERVMKLFSTISAN
jgi:hypothetical protein